MKQETEKPKDKSEYVPDGKNGGWRPGAGRKKGGENKETKDKRICAEEMRQRVIKSSKALMDSQMNLAKGCQLLFKIETYKYKDKDGNWKEEKKKPAIVESREEIENYLAGDYDKEDVYYFITTKLPDNKAIESLFDRTFGKAPQSINFGMDDERLSEISIKIVKNEKDKSAINNSVREELESVSEQKE